MYTKMIKLITICFLWLVLNVNPAEVRTVRGCSYATEKGVHSADCSESFLTQFPTDLKESIEGLYLSWNFIRNLENSTFERYSNIKFLYLDQNPGLIPESHTFAPLSKLNTLDLSYIPHLNISNIYLPVSLKKLYLNGLLTISTQLPISSLRDLNYLSLSECKLNEIPSFGGNLPSLEGLNLTANKLANFKVDNLAHLCQLKNLFISDLSIQNNCECLRIQKWLEDQSVGGSHLNCNGTKSHENCDLSSSVSFSKSYDSCKTDVITKKFLYWFLIGCAVFVACFSFVILYVCCNTKGLFCNFICCRCFRKRK